MMIKCQSQKNAEHSSNLDLIFDYDFHKLSSNISQQPDGSFIGNSWHEWVNIPMIPVHTCSTYQLTNWLMYRYCLYYFISAGMILFHVHYNHPNTRVYEDALLKKYLVISAKIENSPQKIETCPTRSFSGNCLSKRQAGRVLAKSLLKILDISWPCC